MRPGYPAVIEVQPGSPAERAGLASGDVILEVNGKDVSQEPSALFPAVGLKYILRIRRGEAERELELIPLLDRPKSQ